MACISSLPASQIASWFKESWSSSNYAFVIKPISMDGKITINKEVATSSQPKFALELELNPVVIALDKNQYYGLVMATEYFSWLALRSKYDSLRPVTFTRTNAKDWWLFACNAVLVDFRRRTQCWSWDYIRKRRDLRLKYISTFIEKLSGSDVTSKLRDQEGLLDVKDIIQYRKLAHAKHSAAMSLKQSNSSLTGWFSSFFTPPPIPKTFDMEVEKRRFYDMIDSDENFDDVITETTVDATAKLALPQLTVSLLDSDPLQNLVLRMALGGYSIQYSRRPAAKSIQIITSLRELVVVAPDRSGQLLDIIHSGSDQSEPAVMVLFETNPLSNVPGVKPSAALAVKAKQIHMNLSVDPIVRFMNFIVLPDASLGATRNNISKKLSQLRNTSRIGLRHIIENRKVRIHHYLLSAFDRASIF